MLLFSPWPSKLLFYNPSPLAQCFECCIDSNTQGCVQSEAPTAPRRQLLCGGRGSRRRSRRRDGTGRRLKIASLNKNPNLPMGFVEHGIWGLRQREEYYDRLRRKHRLLNQKNP